MRIGRDTNSVINAVMGSSASKAPEVGMGLTILYWTDRGAGTITRVSPSGKTFWFTGDTAKRIDHNGMSEMQEYEYTPNPNGTEVRAYRTKTGRWRASKSGNYLTLGFRNAYHDYTF